MPELVSGGYIQRNKSNDTVFTDHPLKGGIASVLAVTASTTPFITGDTTYPGTPDSSAGQRVSGLMKHSPQNPAKGHLEGLGEHSRRLSLPSESISPDKGGQHPDNATAQQNPFSPLSIPPILPLFSVSSTVPKWLDNHSGGAAVRSFGYSPVAPVTNNQPQISRTTPSTLISSVASDSVSQTIGAPRSESAPIPLKELETWIQFGEVRSAWLEQRKAAKMNWFQRLGATIERALHRDPAVEFSRRAIMRIQTTPEGREVLGQLQDEYLRNGRKLIIIGGDFRGSDVIRDNGVETINGIRGQANPLEGLYLFNRKFLQFQNRDVAMEYLCGNMSHEMRHLVSRAQIDRLSGRAGAAFSHAFIDEQRARLTGYLVAARLNRGVPTDYSDEALKLIRNPRAFWSDMKSWSIYAHNLDREEMRDPIRSYTRRIAMLRSAIAENDANISLNLPRIASQLDILEKQEGLKEQLRDVRGVYQSLLSQEPGERQANIQMLDAITELRRKLRSPEGKALLQSYTAAHQDPAFRLLQDGFERDMSSLRTLIEHKTLPRFTPKKGQLSWAQFQERVRESQRLHPEYWIEHRARFPVGPGSLLQEVRLERLFHSPVRIP